MPDRHRIRRELLDYFGRPMYAALLRKTNAFAGPKAKALTPESIADGTADYLWNSHPLLDPIEVTELRGRTELYRTHDGGARVTVTRAPGSSDVRRSSSASTLGRSWIERSVMEDIWKATAKYPAGERRQRFLEFVRTSNFVLPEWNDMTALVCMTIPAGAAAVVVRGRGDWKAMKTPAGRGRPGGAMAIQSAADVLKQGMMPTPGLPQCLVPLVEGMWVQPVNPKSSTWPFAT